MNCQLCLKELEAFSAGTLSNDLKNQVKLHLEDCNSCKEIFRLQILAEKVMRQEKEVLSDPFLATRIMARVNKLEDQKSRQSLIAGVLKPVLITTSLAAAVLLGIMMGNLTVPSTNMQTVPMELSLIDDAALESVDILSNE